MPVKRTAWACKFGCGRKVDTQKWRMAAHETKCNVNPARRSCPTCAYNDRDVDETYDWYCMEDRLPEGETLVYDCEHWAPTESEGEG